MFERFTERARQVVVLAQDEARALRHNYIGTEHLLLGLLREEEGIAARVLGELGVTVDEVRAQVGRIVGQGDEEVDTGQIPFTPRAKKVLELALREAQALGHQYIGTEHVLLGLLRLTSGTAHVALRDLGIDMQSVRKTIDAVLGREERTMIQQIIPTSRVKKVIEIAFEEARRMGTNSVDSGHLLIALTIEGEGIAAHVLADLGAGQKQVIAAVERAMGSTPTGRHRPPGRNLPYGPTQMIASTTHEDGAGSDAEALLRLLQLPHIANLLRAKGLVEAEGLAAKLGEPPPEIIRLRLQLQDILHQLSRAEQDWLRKLSE